MATEPKTIRETSFILLGLEQRLDLIQKMVWGVIGLLGTVLAGATALYIQIGDLKTETAAIKRDIAAVVERLGRVERKLEEIGAAQNAISITLARIESRLTQNIPPTRQIDQRPTQNNPSPASPPSVFPDPTRADTPLVAALPLWIQQINPGQWRASKLRDINVYNNNNEMIGKIDDILLDRSGRAELVVIDVGGFLGIGKHTVALPYNQVKFVDEPRDSGQTTSSYTTSTGAGPDKPAPTGGDDSARGDRPAAAIGANRDNTRDRGYPDRAILNMTKDQLKAAPEFQWSTRR